jgi:hypothetical protein
MNWVLLIVIQAIYFIMPAWVANMFPVLLRKMLLPGSFPIHETWFGKNKTWKWFISGAVWAFLVLSVQKYLASAWYLSEIALLDYTSISLVVYSILFGRWALLWDLVESFIKRRIGIAPWWAFFPWDQLDRVIASLLLVSLVFTISWLHILAIVIITPLLHVLINLIWYALWLKDVWW